MKLSVPVLTLCGLIATFTDVTLAQGETKSETAYTGLEIAQERKRRDTGWKDYTANTTMVLRNAHGEESRRVLSVKVLEVEDEGDKSLNVFSYPNDVKGTALLSVTYIEQNDDQWLYLPALKRTKRIASANQSGPFMGSEFSYEDLTSFEVAKYSYDLIGEESCPEVEAACFKLQATPTYDNSGYQKLVIWIDQEHYRPQKADFYDLRGNHLKTLMYREYQRYNDQFWRPHLLVMTNHQTGKSTDLVTSDIAFGNGLSDRDFHPNILTRLR